MVFRFTIKFYNLQIYFISRETTLLVIPPIIPKPPCTFEYIFTGSDDIIPLIELKSFNDFKYL